MRVYSETLLSHYHTLPKGGPPNIGSLGMTPTLPPSHTSSLGLGSLFRADAKLGCPLSSRSTRSPLDFHRNQASGSRPPVAWIRFVRALTCAPSARTHRTQDVGDRYSIVAHGDNANDCDDMQASYQRLKKFGPLLNF